MVFFQSLLVMLHSKIGNILICSNDLTFEDIPLLANTTQTTMKVAEKTVRYFWS